MPSSPIIAVVGLCGAGKSEVAKRFVQRGYRCVYFGQITMEELERRHLPINEANERQVRERFRKEYGMAAFAILNGPKIDDWRAGGDHTIIDGLYSWSEYKLLKEKYGDALKVVAVSAPPELRYARLAIRQSALSNDGTGQHRPLSREEARERDYAEIENIEKAGPIAMADVTLLNIGTLDDLDTAVDDLHLTLTV